MYKKQTDEKVKRFKEIVDNMADLYAKKNDNYGDSFTKLYDTLGPIAGLVPLHNKLDRLTNLITTSKTSSFESVEDTLKDLACYSIMFLMEYEKVREPEELNCLNSDVTFACKSLNEIKRDSQRTEERCKSKKGETHD